MAAILDTRADLLAILNLHAALMTDMCGSRGGSGGPDPPEKSQKYRVS